MSEIKPLYSEFDNSIYGYQCGECDGHWKIYQDEWHQTGCSFLEEDAHVFHVLPTNDNFEHWTKAYRQCPCKPKITENYHFPNGSIRGKHVSHNRLWPPKYPSQARQ